MKDLKIEVPEGYEVDEKNSTFTNIKFKPVSEKLPEKWEDLKSIQGYYVRSHSDIQPADTSTHIENRNVWPTEELAEAALALSQLCQLRDVYNDGWFPNWGASYLKHVIYYGNGGLIRTTFKAIQFVMSFKTQTLRDKFLDNFKDLLEVAKPLL